MAERHVKLLLLALLAGAPLASLQAQGRTDAEPAAGGGAGETGADDPYGRDEIVITGARSAYPILRDAIPETQFDSREIAGFGAGNIGDLLGALSAQTRGSGAGGPIYLLNGRRIAGFSEVSSLPPEAVDRIDVLAEEVALKYGYGPGARVVNILLLPRYRAAVAEGEQNFATEGGRAVGRADLNLLRIRSATRWNLSAQYRRETSLLESERNVVQPLGDAPFALGGNVVAAVGGAEIDPALSRLAGTQVTIAGVPPAAAGTVPGLAAFAAGANAPNVTATGRYRTLLPDRARFSLAGTLSGFVLGDVSATLNVRAETSEADSLLGLPGGSLLLPVNAAVSPFAAPVRLYRYFGEGGAVARTSRDRSGEIGLAFSGGMASWAWSLTAGYGRAAGTSRTDAAPDLAPVQSRLDAGIALNPFGPLALGPAAARDRSHWSSATGNAELTAYGPLVRLPAGPLSASVTLAGQAASYASSARAGGFSDSSRVSRNRGSVQVSFDLPISSPDAAAPLLPGRLSANFTVAASRLSGFGTIRRVGYGLNWAPVRAMTLTVAALDEQRAPSVEQLGDPLVVTPNARVLDFARGDTVEVARLDGGNPFLTRGRRRVLNLGTTLRPLRSADLVVRADYAHAAEHDPVAAFPAYTTALEAAFPERFTRDAGGRLLQVDYRPVNFARTRRDDLRWGVSATIPVHARPPTGPPARVGQFDLSLFDNWSLKDRATLRKGLPPLDFLNGAAAGSGGGRAHHQLELQAGLYRKGIGMRVSGVLQGPSTIRRLDGGAQETQLRFGSLVLANLRLFADLGQQPGLMRRAPWAKGTRVSLAVTNAFNRRPDVRDRTGRTPIGYQPAYLDPVGRTIGLSLRKVFS